MKNNLNTEKNFNPSYIGLRKDLLKYIEGENLNILDVGCATGENASFLLNNNIAEIVVGIEIDQEMGIIAKEKLSHIIIGNIEQQEVIDQIPKGFTYDYILLGDVLEHLYDPWKVLKFLSGLLKPNGKVIISLPNVQHMDVFIHLFIRGEWAYNERGLFDKTHLRWFTRKNIFQLIKSSDLEIKKIERKFRYRDNPKSAFPFYGRLLKIFFKNLYTFQYVIVANRKVEITGHQRHKI